MSNLKYKWSESPVGLLKIVSQDAFIVAILWECDREDRVKLGPMVEEINNPLLLLAEAELNAYFTHQSLHFQVPTRTEGTPFQEAVWKALKEIPYGSTWTYLDVARKIERPQAVRAVGTAVGRNPLSIIIPCHRVIGTNGKLTGFAGGLVHKKTLLQLERKKP